MYQKGEILRLWQPILSLMYRILRAIVWTAGVITVALICLFFVAEQPVPHQTLDKLLASLSTSTDALDARTATFGLRHGLVLRKVRLLPKGVVAPEWFTADELRLSGGFRPDRPVREWIDTVVAHRINIASLPSRSSGHGTTNASATIPALPAMRFDLVDANFLGMRFKRLQGFLHQEKGVILIENARIEWPSDHGVEEVSGTLQFDPATSRIEGQLAGRLFPERIYPLLHMLEARGVENIAQRFVFGDKPAVVEARFRIAPEEQRDELRVVVTVAECTYDGVPIRRATAVIEAHGSNDLDHIAVRQLVCERPDGKLTGDMTIDTTTSNLDFVAQSSLPSEPLLRIVRVNVSPEKFGILFATPPQVTASGRVPLDGNLDGIRILGTLAAPLATVHHIPLQNLQCDFGISSNTYVLRNVHTTTAGGDISGTITMVVPPDDMTQATYRSSFKIDHMDVETFAAQLGFTNHPLGKANAEIALASCFGANHERRLNGSGECRLEKATLGRIPLFAGLTDYMARNVPGVNVLIEQSEASVPFVISNGVLRSENALVEGGLFSIGGKGTYSFPEDQLDFNVRASIFKQRTWLGRIVQVVTFPFSKLLLEFRVKGSIDAPAWEYRGVLERIVDTVGGKKGSAP